MLPSGRGLKGSTGAGGTGMGEEVFGVAVVLGVAAGGEIPGGDGV